MKTLIRQCLAPSKPSEKAQVEALILLAERQEALPLLLEVASGFADIAHPEDRVRNTRSILQTIHRQP